MLDEISLFLSCLIISITIFFLMKKLLDNNEKLLCWKNIFLLVLMTVIIFLSHNQTYTIISPLTYFLCIILIYRYIFHLSFFKATLVSGIVMAIIILMDLVATLPFTISSVVTVDKLRSVWYLMLLGNILVSILSMCLISIRPMCEKLKSFLQTTGKTKYDDFIIMLFLFILALTTLVQNVSINFNISAQYWLNIIAATIFAILLVFFLKQKMFSNKIDMQYKMLLHNVEVFESQIDKINFMKHEMGTTLGTMRNLTKSKKLIEKIDSLLSDVQKLDTKWIEELKNLPKGTVKALFYYKMSVAQNKNIHFIVDVSPKIKKNKMIIKLKDSEELSNLLSIYIDNAIDAASETTKREVTVEIYSLKSRLYFTISNTFKEAPNLEIIHEKGVTTKGEGHGRGLYYASKIIDRNSNYQYKQMIIDHYYVIQLIIDCI